MLEMTGEHGPEAVTTRALAARIGITEPALYRHFPGGKPAMWDAFAEALGARFADAWRQAAAAADTPRERLRAIARAQLGLITGVPALPAMLLSRSLHRDNPALKAGMLRQLGRFQHLLRDCAAAAARAGELEADDPDTTAWLVIAIIQGVAVRWSLSDRGFDLVAEGLRLLDAALAGPARGRGD